MRILVCIISYDPNEQQYNSNSISFIFITSYNYNFVLQTILDRYFQIVISIPLLILKYNWILEYITLDDWCRYVLNKFSFMLHQLRRRHDSKD
jgi:hypothetical protein